ncbi:hypothetical protein RGQ29_005088 [Quercus rubra]|uniref:Disease resistance protein At1g50180 n=1 Tax=Quercus rubra TaxID=3512 RepID=A0AAN7E3E0_QUERU|nr:hypothetical protein RGQ29_005088 [Quercus rubra]
MAEAVVSGVVTRIGDLLVQEGKFLSGVSNQVELLQIELKLMQGLLKDADARQNESELVRQWVAEIRDLAYDADDIIATHAHTVGSRKGGGVQKVLERCSCILDEGITVHQVGSKIENIMTKISNLKTSFQGYGIRESMIKGGGSSSFNERQREQRQTFSHLEHDVVGFDDDLNKLVEFLLKEGEDSRVASICGMGGLGKTTLAKMVYNYREVKQHFDCRAWVYISQQCQRRRVWEEILISLLSKDQRDEIQKLTDAEIVEKLRQVQCEKRCLVILDDIWNIEAWNSLQEAFLVRSTGNKILLTSRNKQVCLHVDPRSFLRELQCLNEERSWELLDKIAVSWREDSVTKTYMKKFGKEMIGYCGDLPLAITVLGEQNLRVNRVLALSYNDLPCHLKPCFLYLGHFPEDFEIPTKELIRMWMGEGFVSEIQHNRGREDTMDDVGHRYIRELVQRCMVLVGKMGSLGRIKTCRMHDLMRDFCVSKAQEENFLHITNILSLKRREAQNSKVRRLAIILESNDNYITGIKFSEYPYLRSLLYLPPPPFQNNCIQSYFNFKESCFKKFKLVRVLHLENFQKHSCKLPKDIGCLIYLRYLSLKNSNIKKVSSSIDNLRCLETLDLQIFSKPRVPNVFKYMKQLKHLYLPCSYRVCCKLELGNLSYLQTLVNVQPKTIQIPTWFKFNLLRVLKVRNKKGAQDAIQMLISRCPLIEKLHLYKHLKKLPEAHQFSPNLAKLTLSGTKLEEDPMETLEKLPNLKILYFRYVIQKTSRYESVGRASFNGKNMVCSERGFPLLQSLLLSSLYYLEEWRVEEGAMPSLCRLEIEFCNSLKVIPDGLRFITTLQKLKIKSMSKSFTNRLHEGGPDFDKVKHVPSLVFIDW